MKLSHLAEESIKWHSDFGKQFGNVDNPIWYNEAIPIQDMYPE